ncbi:MAG: hypothetical protein JWM58_727 [Rhizobium sp.]|nr:hypothetical protein [Rhizobium sp.]
MKIGLPKIRITRKVLLISVGMLALLAGSGAAALYVGADKFMDPVEASPIGGECTTIQTMVLKTPARRLWLRKYIRMDHADGSERIKTALRVAGLLAKANAVDLVQVSVLDTKGPQIRSAMRGRAIGAEVVIALQPKYLPDMKEPFIVRYYEGMPSDEGRYYGERISLEIPEIQKLMGAMKSVPDKQDCADLPKPGENSADAKGKKHGEQIVGVMGEQPAGHEKQTEDHAAPADAESADAAPKKEQSFLDSVLSLVGLGASEEKPAENHEAKAQDDSHAVAEEPIDAAPASEDHAAKPADQAEDPAPGVTDENAVEHQPVKAEDHGETPKADKAGEKHVAAEPAGHDALPIENDAH